MKTNKGFSLVETLVAIAIICIAFFMFQSLSNTTTLARSAKNEDMALKITSNKIEELRALGYSSLPTSGSFSDPALSSLPSSSAAMAISDYDTKTKQVTVTVSWTESNGNRSVALTTLLAQTGGLK